MECPTSMDILQPEPHPFQFICETVKLTIEIECWGFNKPRADVYTAYMFQQGVKTIIARVYRALHASLRAYIAHRTRTPHARTARAHRTRAPFTAHVRFRRGQTFTTLEFR